MLQVETNGHGLGLDWAKSLLIRSEQENLASQGIDLGFCVQETMDALIY